MDKNIQIIFSPLEAMEVEKALLVRLANANFETDRHFKAAKTAMLKIASENLHWVTEEVNKINTTTKPTKEDRAFQLKLREELKTWSEQEDLRQKQL